MWLLLVQKAKYRKCMIAHGRPMLDTAPANSPSDG